jgi:hypothetical protein
VASDSEPLERHQRTRQWRIARIERFVERQRKRRKWINFAEIAEYYTREDQSILPIDLLARDLLAGEFEENGRSLVLFLHPTLPPTRATREWLNDVIDYDWGRPYLEHCWIPRRLFEHWHVQNRLPSSPCFEPLDEQSPGRLKKPKRGRPAEYNWSGVKSQLAAYVSQHGPVQTWDELLQKCADFASELHPKGNMPDDSTVRDAIKKYQLDVVAGVSRGK